MAKYIELKGYGNKQTHLIPLNKITQIHFEKSFTSISLANGERVNVIEDEHAIKEMLGFHDVNLVSEERIRTLYFEDEGLPF